MATKKEEEKQYDKLDPKDRQEVDLMAETAAAALTVWRRAQGKEAADWNNLPGEIQSQYREDVIKIGQGDSIEADSSSKRLMAAIIETLTDEDIPVADAVPLSESHNNTERQLAARQSDIDERNKSVRDRMDAARTGNTNTTAAPGSPAEREINSSAPKSDSDSSSKSKSSDSDSIIK